ncbi:MAG: hypothetical protein KF758_04740 [Anaerolineales bacterium]|nr:hypothetical protein [Anaerolineales bacterium]
MANNQNSKKLNNKNRLAEAGRNSALFGLILVFFTVISLTLLSKWGVEKLFDREFQPDHEDGDTLSCAIEEPILFLEQISPRNIYILIDRSSSYKSHSNWALEVVKNVLPKVLLPGDRLTAAWIGKNSASPDGTFCCGKPISDIALPYLLPLPEKPLPKDLVEVDEGSSSMEIMQIEEKNKKIVAENELLLNAYNCAVQERNREAKKLIEKWEIDSKVLINEFWLEIEPSFAIGKYDNSTHIKEALYKASLLLQQDIERNPRFLIIFTDLIEAGPPSFKGVYPKLDEVQVIVVLHCDNAEKCEQLKIEWQSTFANMGAKSPIFIQDSYPEELLISLLQRR